MKDNAIVSKSEDFAVRIVELYKYLNYTKKENVLSKQLLRSGTSIGANISEAQCAQSNSDFLSKLSIAFKECNESRYWLRLLKRTGFLNETEFSSINNDAEEIFSLLTKIIKSIKTK